MLLLNSCLPSSPHCLQWGKIERSKASQVAMKPINRTLNRDHVPRIRKGWFQGLQKTEWITNRRDKSFKGNFVVCVGLEGEYALEFEEESKPTRDMNFLGKQLKAFLLFIRPYGLIGMIVQIISASLLPVQTVRDLSPAFFMGLLKALVPAILMSIYTMGVNHIYDVEIDKINKPYLPLASGDFSMETVIAITSAALSMSLVMGIMISPATFFGLFSLFLGTSAYSIDHPLLRWKKDSFSTITCHVIAGAGCLLGYFIHFQKFVLGKPKMITKSLIFSLASMTIFLIAIMLFKDIPDEEGDKAFGIQSLAMKLGKENLFWLLIKMLLLAYGAAVVVGATSTSLFSRLITVIGHSLLASFLLLRAQSVDLTDEISVTSFYMLIWKLHCAESFLALFVR